MEGMGGGNQGNWGSGSRLMSRPSKPGFPGRPGCPGMPGSPSIPGGPLGPGGHSSFTQPPMTRFLRLAFDGTAWGSGDWSRWARRRRRRRPRSRRRRRCRTAASPSPPSPSPSPSPSSPTRAPCSAPAMGPRQDSPGLGSMPGKKGTLNRIMLSLRRWCAESRE